MKKLVWKVEFYKNCADLWRNQAPAFHTAYLDRKECSFETTAISKTKPNEEWAIADVNLIEIDE